MVQISVLVDEQWTLLIVHLSYILLLLSEYHTALKLIGAMFGIASTFPFLYIFIILIPTMHFSETEIIIIYWNMCWVKDCQHFNYFVLSWYHACAVYSVQLYTCSKTYAIVRCVWNKCKPWKIFDVKIGFKKKNQFPDKAGFICSIVQFMIGLLCLPGPGVPGVYGSRPLYVLLLRLLRLDPCSCRYHFCHWVE